ncbi:MAG: CDP-alcohol phosphatidyltransferase family protein [Actinobacteria bacterium]|nr:CDP-alcohol phosphatidyltransferase family protein [Actinomycetota bacterium]
MDLMLSASLKPAVTRAINPIARGALAIGLTPNAVTFIGALGLVTSALYFYPKGDFFIGTLVISFFALSDLFDGAMARISHKGASAWGGFLDSTIDRITDSAILVGLILYLVGADDPLTAVVIGALVFGSLVPYIRAKAESMQISCSGGIAERTERLIISLTAIGLEGLGVPFALAIGIWLLLILAVVTVIQRILIVKAAL